MAEAIARHLAADVIEASSAGLAAFGDIPATTIAVLAERGFSAEGQSSKPLRPEDLSAADLVINMTGRGGKSIFSAPTLAFEIGMWATRTDSTLSFTVGFATRLKRAWKGWRSASVIK